MLFLQNHRHGNQSHTIMNAELEAYPTFTLTYRRFLNYKLQQFLENFQFFLGRVRIVAPLFMDCCFFHEFIDTASRHSSRQTMNAVPKQVEVYRNFILTKCRFLKEKHTNSCLLNDGKSRLALQCVKSVLLCIKKLLSCKQCEMEFFETILKSQVKNEFLFLCIPIFNNL